MVIISLPGYNEWAQKLEDEQNHLKHLEDQPNTSRRLEPTKLKRTYDETEESSEVMEVENEGSSKERRTKEDLSEPSNVVSREHLLNFPLPDVASKSCIVKVRVYFVVILIIKQILYKYYQCLRCWLQYDKKNYSY